MKKISFLSALLALSTVAFAAPVGRQQAQQKAVAFLEKQNKSAQLSSSAPFRAKSAALTVEQSPYYIFNTEGNKGFIIVSGDDRTEEILGYSDAGSFDPENIPDGLQALLDAYEQEINELGDMEVFEDVAAKSRKAMARPRQSVEPFNKRTWSQGSPHNGQLPTLSGSHCSAGCVGVAMAEAIGCFSYPSSVKAISSYTCASGVKASALAAATINWKNICDNYIDVTTTSTQKNEVAKLFRYVTQSITTNYKSSSSTSNPSRIPAALKTYFNFESTAKQINATDYSFDDFIDILYNEVAEHRPVIVSGFSLATLANASAGHSYIMDGYDKDDLFHFDWGWGGSCRGYYRLSALSPFQNVRNRAYMKSLSAVVGIQPKGYGGTVHQSEIEEQDRSLTLTSVSVPTSTSAVSSVTVSVGMQNQNAVANNYDHAVALYDSNYGFVKILKSYAGAAFATAASKTSTYSVSFADVANGTYYLVPVSRVSNYATWHTDRCLSTNSCIKAVVTSKKAVCTNVPAIVVNSMKIDEADKSNAAGAPQEITMNVTNNTFDVYQKQLYLFASTKLVQCTAARIPMHCTEDVHFTYENESVGTYTLKVTTDEDGTKLLAPNLTVSATTKAAVTYGNKLTATLVSDNLGSKTSTEGYLYTDKYKITVNIKNNGSVKYNDYVRLIISNSKNINGQWHYTEKVHVNLAAGATQKLTFESNELNPQLTYYVRIINKGKSTVSIDNYSIIASSTTAYASNVYQNYNRGLAIKHKNGYRYWTTDGEVIGMPASTAAFTVPENVLAVSFDTTTMPASITPNKNPNTLYYFAGTPSYTNLKNVITKGVAASITLEDGYPCLVPVDFTATKIVYNRVFNKGYNGVAGESNWSTIVLPFDVQTITNKTNNSIIDWFHSADDKSKKFWMQQFYGIDGHKVYFDYTDKFAANVPYLISVPGNKWGSAFNLVGKKIEFSAKNAAVKAGDMTLDAPNRNFIGCTTGVLAKDVNIYILNDETGTGNNFDYTPDASAVKPFRAYFTTESRPLNVGTKKLVVLRHGMAEVEDETDGIKLVTGENMKSANIYSINGKIAGRLTSDNIQEALDALPEGVYIINGKKYIK